MPSWCARPTVRPNPLRNNFIRAHVERLRLEEPEWSAEECQREADRRWTQPETYSRAPFWRCADKANKKDQHQIAEYERRRALPSTTQLLSSLRRPAPSAAAVSSQSTDCLASLPTPLLHLLLAFVPDVELFCLFPRLSTTHRWLFTDAAFHRSYGQQRFELSDCQWRLFSAVPFPQLTVPVHAYAYYGYHQPFGLTLFDDRKDRVDASADGGAKDWALESVCLQQHMRYATLYLTRAAPTHTAAGRAVRYRLPRLIRALLLDQLTSRAVTPLSRGYVQDQSAILNLRYVSSFQPRRSVHEPIVV